MVFWVTEFENVMDFSFVGRRDVMTSRHDVTKPDLPISACICARKFILFSHGFFKSLKSKNVIAFAFVWKRDVMTSCHEVTKPDLLISAFRCARKLILFLFPCFLGHWVQRFEWFSILFMFLRHDVMSWRHGNTYHHPTALADLVVEP